MTWTVVGLGGEVICGGCRAVLGPGQPVAIVATARLRRCEACAAEMGFTPDAQELDRELFRQEQERLAGAAPADPIAHTYPPRVPRPRPMLPFSELGELAFDSKAAAVGRDDD